MSDAYAASGVDIDAGNETVRRYRALLGGRQDPRVLEGIGGFGGCFAFEGYRDPVLVASTDGVGTKVLVAAALRRFDTIGADLVQHCIDDILCAGARPLFFLDYFATGSLDPEVAEAIVSGVAQACARNGVALLGGETAEMPGVYASDRFDLAGTIVGAMERGEMLDASRVIAGDVVIGLPSNGFHTNGYSLVRRTLPVERWGETVDGADVTIGDALLAIHPSYLPYVDAIRRAGVTIKSMAHITGGGLVDNVPRALPDTVAARFDRARWRIPPVMAQVVKEARLRDEEAYRVFNMGIGFCVIASGDDGAKAVTAARAAIADRPIGGAKGATASIVAEIEPRHSCGPQVVIQ